MVTTEDKLGERARREERRMKRGLGEIESNKQQQPPSTQTHHTATAIDTHSLLSCVSGGARGDLFSSTVSVSWYLVFLCMLTTPRGQSYDPTTRRGFRS